MDQQYHMDLQAQTETLLRQSQALTSYGTDGTPVFQEDLAALAKEVFSLANALYPSSVPTAEEEASLCLALLIAYTATPYNDGDKAHRIQTILNRSWEVLEKLPSSLLKCRLLVHCYAELPDENLASQAHLIINTWQERPLTPEERDTMELLEILEEAV